MSKLDDLVSPTRIKALEKDYLEKLSRSNPQEIARTFARLEAIAEALGKRLEAHETALNFMQLPIVREVAERQQLVRIVDIPSDAGLSERDGFYPAEYTEDGSAFRWTGPGGIFRYVVLIDRAEAVTGRLYLLGTGKDWVGSKPSELKIKVDGALVEYSAEFADGQEVVEFEIPKSKKDHPTVIEFKSNVWSPADFGEEDTRLLGLAVARFLLISTLGDQD